MLQTEPYGGSNIYFQMLKGVRMATTNYIAIAEDDVLYVKEHFNYRPPLDTFAYNMNRFNVFTWGKPIYFWKHRMGNFTLVAPRLLALEALEERFNKYPKGLPLSGELGRENVEKKLKVTVRKSMWFQTETSLVHVDHELGIDRLAVTHRKGRGILQCYDIPHWGKAEDVIKQFKQV